MDYSAHYQQQAYDPSSVTQQFWDQSTNDYYSYYYSNPQYTNVQSYSYPNLTAQPSQHEEQEPNPPGVTAAPPPQLGQNSYYPYHAHGAAAGIFNLGPQQGGVDAGVPVVHQPIVQPPYEAISVINGFAPGGGAPTHLGPQPNVLSGPYHARGRGRGRALHKHAPPPAQNQTISIQGGSYIQVGPPQAMPNASSFGPIPTPTQPPAHPVPVLPPPKAVRCELCRVDCNTLEILEQHKNGKKHKKKLKVFEELQKLSKMATGRQTEIPSTSQLQPEVPSSKTLPSQATNEGVEVIVEKQKVEEVEPAEESTRENVKTKPSQRGLKRKMKGGKVDRRMKPCGRPQRPMEPPKPKEVIPLVCELCNVKCESPVVFQSHLVGKKHLSKAKRFLADQNTLGQVVLPALQPQPLPTNIGAQILKAEGKSEGQPGCFVAAQMIGAATGTTLDGAYMSDQLVRDKIP